MSRPAAAVADLSALGDDELETQGRSVPLSNTERTDWPRIGIPASITRDDEAETIEQRLVALQLSERRAREQGYAKSGTPQATRQTAERQAALLRERVAMQSRRPRVHGMASSLAADQLPLPMSSSTRQGRPVIVISDDESEDEQGIVGAIARMSQAVVCSNAAEEAAVREALAILRAAKKPRRISLR